MTMPDFLVVGAARSATTSLHYYLDQHPGITMSQVKEPNFFAFDHSTQPPTPLIDPSSSIVTKSVRQRAAYEALFAHAGPGDVLGEASPLYLYVRETPEQVEHVLGRGCRFVAVLRNPIDRAYSHHLHIHRSAADDAVASFRAACEQEMAAGPGYTPYASGTHVLRLGRYDEQLERYTSRFGAESMLVLPYEAVVGDPQSQLDRVCRHVGVEPFTFDTEVKYNPSGVTRGRVGAAVNAVVRKAQPRVKAVLPASVAGRLGRLRATFDRPDEAPPCPADLRERLAEWYADDVARLVARGAIEPGQWSDFT